MTIGEFSRRSRLSAKALRLYDELGLLPPARVDAETGYRFYADEQLERARLVAGLRQLGLALADIKEVVALDPAEAARRVEVHWAGVEADHAARRRLSAVVVDRLNGRSSVMYDVTTRSIPARSLLCLESRVESTSEVWALGKRFIGIMRSHPLPRLEGAAGAFFLVYYGEVNEDSDGPVAMCRPVPDDQVEAAAAELPELVVRHEPEHEEAYVHLGVGAELNPAQWQVVSESLETWAAEHARLPSGLGVRITYTVIPGVSEQAGPDCDFAVPLA